MPSDHITFKKGVLGDHYLLSAPIKLFKYWIGIMAILGFLSLNPYVVEFQTEIAILPDIVRLVFLALFFAVLFVFLGILTSHTVESTRIPM